MPLTTVRIAWSINQRYFAVPLQHPRFKTKTKRLLSHYVWEGRIDKQYADGLAAHVIKHLATFGVTAVRIS